MVLGPSANDAGMERLLFAVSLFALSFVSQLLQRIPRPSLNSAGALAVAERLRVGGDEMSVLSRSTPLWMRSEGVKEHIAHRPWCQTVEGWGSCLSRLRRRWRDSVRRCLRYRGVLKLKPGGFARGMLIRSTVGATSAS